MSGCFQKIGLEVEIDRTVDCHMGMPAVVDFAGPGARAAGHSIMPLHQHEALTLQPLQRARLAVIAAFRDWLVEHLMPHARQTLTYPRPA